MPPLSGESRTGRSRVAGMDGTPVSLILGSAGQSVRLDIRSPGPAAPCGALRFVGGEALPVSLMGEGKPTRFQRWVGDSVTQPSLV